MKNGKESQLKIILFYIGLCFVIFFGIKICKNILLINELKLLVANYKEENILNEQKLFLGGYFHVGFDSIVSHAPGVLDSDIESYSLNVHTSEPNNITRTLTVGEEEIQVNFFKNEGYESDYIVLYSKFANGTEIDYMFISNNDKFDVSNIDEEYIENNFNLVSIGIIAPRSNFSAEFMSNGWKLNNGVYMKESKVLRYAYEESTDNSLNVLLYPLK